MYSDSPRVRLTWATKNSLVRYSHFGELVTKDSPFLSTIKHAVSIVQRLLVPLGEVYAERGRNTVVWQS